LALIETYKKNYDLSEKLLKGVLKASEEKNYTLTKARVLDLLTLLYYAKNDFAKGERYFLIAKNFKDSVTQSSSEILITEAETKYKTAEKEAKLKEAELEISEKRNWIIGISLGFLGILIAGGLLWRISSIKTRAFETEKLKNLEIENQKKLLSAKEIERQRIAKELHDSVGSQLTVVSTSLDNAFYLFENQKLKPEKLENISGEVRLAAQSLRDTIWATYNSEITVLDLKSRIQEFIKKFADENAFKLEMEISGDQTVLNPIEGLNLFRIVQESLNNIQKYAQASMVKIEGIFENGNYNLQISDNGLGFDLNKANTGNSYGLGNMKSRAEEIGGELSVSSSSEGTVVEFSKKS
jgi:signal transduction histidine kinase